MNNDEINTRKKLNMELYEVFCATCGERSNPLTTLIIFLMGIVCGMVMLAGLHYCDRIQHPQPALKSHVTCAGCHL